MPIADNAQRSLRSFLSIAFAALALAGPGRALAQSAPPAEAPRARAAAEAPPADAAEAPPADAAEAPRAGETAEVSRASATAEVSRASATAPVLVDVRGTEGVLEARGNPARRASDDDDDEWRPVCAMPCRRALDPRLEYRVAGAGISRTKPFRLPIGQPNLRLDVETGSRASRVLGIVFIPVGATVLGVSLLGSLVSSAIDDDNASRNFLIAAGVGAVVMTGGIMLVRNNRSSVHAAIPGEPSLRLASGLALTPRGLVF